MTPEMTDREAEILKLIASGYSNQEIAGTLYLSPNTVKSYIRSLYAKIGVSTRVYAVLWAADHGYMPRAAA